MNKLIAILTVAFITAPLLVRSQVLVVGTHRDSLVNLFHSTPTVPTPDLIIISSKRTPLIEVDSTLKDDRIDYLGVNIAGYKGNYSIYFWDNKVSAFVWEMKKQTIDDTSTIFFELLSHLSSIFGAPNYMYTHKGLDTRTFGWLYNDIEGYLLKESPNSIKFEVGNIDERL